MVRNLMFLFVLLLSYTLSAQEKPKSAEQFINELDKKIPQLLHDFSVPGAAIAIIENGEVVLQNGYGFANVKKERRVDLKTGFNIASISKTIAAWGVMKLVQEGKIDLDAPAEEYLTRWRLPESEFNSKEVTIRRLLSHTAGLSLHGYPGWSSLDALPTIEESLNGNNNGPSRVEVVIQPGTKYQYSGGGFTILQLIIEEVTGQKFEDYMQEQILNPLGMTNSSYKIDSKIMTASASEYDDFGEEMDFELFTAQAAAGLHTTIEDFTHFALANIYQDQKKDKSVLSPDIIAHMMVPVPATKGNYGLGYEIDTREVLKGLVGHSGNNTGWHAIFRINPKTNDGFIVFTNGGLGYNIMNVVLCEWVSWKTGESLWKGCLLKKPIASTLKRIIDHKGIQNIATTYMTLKEEYADAYDFSESQLNNLGYYYMSRKEFQKAIIIFKLNVDTFPDDYNVYDSYGEALLARGARKEAIENYMKSVLLHPGNENGIKVLKEQGISTDDIIENISFPVNSKVLTTYVGRYQTSTGETVTIKKSKGHLYAKMQEKRLDLIAQSTARFHALDTGTIITFFTAATGQQGFWAMERIWSKLPDVPASVDDNKGVLKRSTEWARSSKNVLVFRNKPSWGRLTDFENVLVQIGCNYKQQTSSKMMDIALSLYDIIIIPGAQNSDFYDDYIRNIERFDEYVAKGGTLILELNGAEKNKSMKLPRGVTITPQKAVKNSILESDHPIFYPLSGKRTIHARYVSNGYLRDVPDEAVVLAIEAEGMDTFIDRPTFIEYTYGNGRVIAASQCFHDRDGSGRGPLMESVISYALNKLWSTKD